MIIRKKTLFFLVLFFAALPGMAEVPPDLAAQAKAALPQTSGTLQVPGLARPVTVLRDRWGVPHIYAETQDDLFFAQGFVAAQDRLWQLDLWRRAGMGELAEVLGPEAVDRDRFARLLRYRGDLEAEYASYAPDARQILAAFVRGVNASIESRRGRWPLEFQLAGFAPEPWTPEVCLSRMAAWEVTMNASFEVLRARLGQEIGWALLEELAPTDPSRPLAAEPRIGLEGIGDQVLALPRAAGVPLRFNAREGSNNWVVGGALSATGRPLLANDPHRALRLPSLRYLVHLVGPGWDVIGAGEPALPGVAAGHNGQVAFGFTVTGIDQQDLYVEETHPDNPHLYRYQGRWERMRIERETIAVRGAAPIEVELKFTVHGPVLHEDPARRRAWALRWVGSEPGTAGYLGSLSLNRARTWPEFLAALERWKVPSENLVYADVEGNIGWKVAGLAPVRKGWSGLLPVPGGGEHEWQGFLPAAELPGALNPPERWVATANHNILPPGFKHELAFDWGAPTRFHRLREVLGRPESRFTVADFERLQHDETSLPARSLIALLREVPGVDAELRPFVDLLTRWDAVVARDSAAAALYEIWVPRLGAAVFKPHLPEKLWETAVRMVSGEKIIATLTGLSPRWLGPDPRAGRDAALLASLREAVAEAKEKLGPDPAAWRWGALHKATFRHALATDGATRALFDFAPVERGGDGDTVHVTVGLGFDVAHGGSFREILDVGDWDRSVATSVPGQSGQPGSPHYGDLLPLWADGRYFPLLYSRERVEAEAAQRLVLEPARR